MRTIEDAIRIVEDAPTCIWFYRRSSSLDPSKLRPGAVVPVDSLDDVSRTALSGDEFKAYVLGLLRKATEMTCEKAETTETP